MSIDTSKYYLLTTQFVEQRELFLESNGGIDPNTPLGGSAYVTAPAKSQDGMHWKFESAGQGYYRLTSKLVEGKGLLLNSNGGFDPNSELGGGSFMSLPNHMPTGTLWKLVPQPGGYYRMTTQLVEKKDLWLEGNGGLDPNNQLGGAAFMSAQNPAPTGTFWRIIAV